MINWPVDCLIDRLSKWLIRWSIDWQQVSTYRPATWTDWKVKCLTLASQVITTENHKQFRFHKKKKFLNCCNLFTQGALRTSWGLVDKCPLSKSNWNLDVLGLKESRKPEYPEKNLSEQGKELTTNSTHIWRWHRDLNPGHTGGRRVLSPLRHPCSPWIRLGSCFMSLW